MLEKTDLGFRLLDHDISYEDARLLRDELLKELPLPASSAPVDEGQTQKQFVQRVIESQTTIQPHDLTTDEPQEG